MELWNSLILPTLTKSASQTFPPQYNMDEARALINDLMKAAVHFHEHKIDWTNCHVGCTQQLIQIMQDFYSYTFFLSFSLILYILKTQTLK